MWLQQVFGAVQTCLERAESWCTFTIETGNYILYILRIDCYCVKGLWCCFPIPLLIFIYFMMGLLIYKYTCKPLWQDSDTQVTVKAYGPLVIFSSLLRGIDQRNWILNSNDYQGRIYQNCKFQDPMDIRDVVCVLNYIFDDLFQYTAHLLLLY